MHTRLAALVAAGVLVLSVAIGLPAWAQDTRPAVGTVACTTAVEADPLVLQGVASVKLLQTLADQLPDTATQDQRDAAEGNLEAGESQLMATRAFATERLCAPAQGTRPLADSAACTTAVEGSALVLQGVASVKLLQTLLDQLPDNATEDQVDAGQGNVDAAEAQLTATRASVTQRLCASATTTTTPSTTTSTTTPPSSSPETVDPVADDGSTAITSGDQVTDVPVGSAQTGT